MSLLDIEVAAHFSRSALYSVALFLSILIEISLILASARAVAFLKLLMMILG